MSGALTSRRICLALEHDQTECMIKQSIQSDCASSIDNFMESEHYERHTCRLAHVVLHNCKVSTLLVSNTPAILCIVLLALIILCCQLGIPSTSCAKAWHVWHQATCAPFACITFGFASGLQHTSYTPLQQPQFMVESVLDRLGEEVTGIVSPVSLCMALTVALVRLLNPTGDSAGSSVYIASAYYKEQVRGPYKPTALAVSPGSDLGRADQAASACRRGTTLLQRRSLARLLMLQSLSA